MSDSDSDTSVFEFDFDTDISEFSGFSASDEESSDSETEDIPDLEWQEDLTPPTVCFCCYLEKKNDILSIDLFLTCKTFLNFTSMKRTFSR